MHLRIVSHFSLLLLVLLTSACVTTTKPLESGQFISDGYKPGTLPIQIALPEGKWEVAEYTTSSNNNNTFIISSTFIERKGNQVSRAVSFTVPKEAAMNGYVVSKFCSRDNMHFRETEASQESQKQKCFWVNHYRPTYAGSKSIRKRKIGEYLNKNNLEPPSHLIQVGYRFADEIEFINVNFYFNPVVDGFSKDPRTSWTGSPWHPSNTALVPSRQEYIDKLINWAKQYKSSVENAFNGLAPTLARVNKVKSTRMETAPSSITQRLEALKKLYSNGLITEAEFELKKSEILKGL